jgi:uncharacterized delta-60 repeat protein
MRLRSALPAPRHFNTSTTLAVLLVAVVALPANAAAGDLDTSFSSDGIASSSDFGGSSRGATDMLVAPDGSVLVAGERGRTVTSNFAVFRFTPAGAPDTTFSGDGIAVVDFGSREETEEIALMSDGRIVVVGTQIDASNHRHLAVAVLTSKGKLDPSFSGDGRLVRAGSTDSWGYGVAVDAADRIVIAGSRNFKLTLFRYLPTGAVDTTFGVGGAINVAGMSANTFSNLPEDVDVAIQPDGRILALGIRWREPPTGNSDCAVARLTAAGQVDASFSGDGIASAGFPPDTLCSGIALSADTGKITVAGSTSPGEMALARFTSSGDLDANFDGDGRVVASLGEGESRAFGVTLDGQKTIAAGFAQVGGQQVWVVARFTAQGQLDPTFSDDGTVFLDLSPDSSDSATVPILDGARVLVAGILGVGAPFAVAAFIV